MLKLIFMFFFACLARLEASAAEAVAPADAVPTPLFRAKLNDGGPVYVLGEEHGRLMTDEPSVLRQAMIEISGKKGVRYITEEVSADECSEDAEVCRDRIRQRMMLFHADNISTYSFLESEMGKEAFSKLMADYERDVKALYENEGHSLYVQSFDDDTFAREQLYHPASGLFVYTWNKLRAENLLDKIDESGDWKGADSMSQFTERLFSKAAHHWLDHQFSLFDAVASEDFQRSSHLFNEAVKLFSSVSNEASQAEAQLEKDEDEKEPRDEAAKPLTNEEESDEESSEEEIEPYELFKQNPRMTVAEAEAAAGYLPKDFEFSEAYRRHPGFLKMQCSRYVAHCLDFAREFRQKGWAPKLQESLEMPIGKEGSTKEFFIAVGSNHLPDESGIFRMLERYGLAEGLEQLMSDNTWRKI